jgi:thymidylate synthase
MQIRAKNLKEGINNCRHALALYGKTVTTENWQGDKSPFKFIEIVNLNLECVMEKSKEKLQDLCEPFLPWADEHFEERVGGVALNPPPTHTKWLSKTEEYLESDSKFSHSYPERLWSKGLHKGIRYEIADLSDAVELLKKDLHTRQCYIPMFFPEDLSAANENKRIPCTLGWHFLVRDNKMHCQYPMRSCDALRHFHNDLYFANLLVLWMIEQVGVDLEPGAILFSATSFHCFENDVYALNKSILKNKLGE